MLHVGICYRQIANEVLLQGSLVMEITGWEKARKEGSP